MRQLLIPQRTTKDKSSEPWSNIMRTETYELHFGRINGNAAYQPKDLGTKQSVNRRTERRHFYTRFCNAAGGYAPHEADAELAKGGFLSSRGETQMKCIGMGSKNDQGRASFDHRRLFIRWWSVHVAGHKLEVRGGHDEASSLCSSPGRSMFRHFALGAGFG